MKTKTVVQEVRLISEGQVTVSQASVSEMDLYSESSIGFIFSVLCHCFTESRRNLSCIHSDGELY